jgi:hypothetical protein
MTSFLLTLLDCSLRQRWSESQLRGYIVLRTAKVHYWQVWDFEQASALSGLSFSLFKESTLYIGPKDGRTSFSAWQTNPLITVPKISWGWGGDSTGCYDCKAQYPSRSGGWQQLEELLVPSLLWGAGSKNQSLRDLPMNISMSWDPPYIMGVIDR